MQNSSLGLRLVSVAALACLFAAGCGSNDSSEQVVADAGVEASPPPAAPIIDLRADTNRDGVVEVQGDGDDTGEDVWDKSHGAVFLANIDDDQLRCSKDGTDVELAACNDAADEVINGDDDLLDLARIKTRPWPEAEIMAKGTITWSTAAQPFVRMFRKQADGTFKVVTSPVALTADDLSSGVELAIEGRDIVRDRTVWDGYIDVTLTVTHGLFLDEVTSDVVKMRMSPVMTQHHLQPVDTAYVSLLNDPDSEIYRADFAKAVQAAQVPNGVQELDDLADLDQWTQDFFEVGYMSMPATAGSQHVVHVYYRSANVDNPKNPDDALRAAGKIVFTRFRGKDSAGVQEFDLSHDGNMDSLNSFGNTETVPPYGDYPLGRLFRGSAPTFFPDPKMTKLMEAQAVQPPIYIDTSWLLVGHVDETISFAKASSPRGWIVLANDARLAKKMLEDEVAKGHGDVKMFEGVKWLNDNWTESPAEVTIQQALNNTEVMSESAKAAVEVDSQIETIKKETGLTDEEIVHLPFLHYPAYGFSLAWQPGTVNSTYLSDSHFAAPDPHGPIIDGKDIFKTQLEEALKPYGITVDWVENWNLYHRLEGEVHCGSNVMRQTTGPKWWESGR
ncbi:MAG: protein-arginine deiminase [Deltaproteobacteria bacterium]|nr:protein-arginine deiminase [Deltaproteobacteria bacterium]